MCAAPGSKTFQMLEMLHSGSTAATGLVVANDSDAKRCNLLAHQTKRMCSPSMLVSNHEGQVRSHYAPLSCVVMHFISMHGAMDEMNRETPNPVCTAGLPPGAASHISQGCGAREPHV